MNSVWRTINFNLDTKFCFHFSLWCNVNNANDIQTKIHSKQFPSLSNAVVILFSSDFIIDIVQIEAAVTQALIHYNDESSGGMYTRGLATEILYCLSPNRSITHALDAFGLKASTKELIVGIIYPTDVYQPYDGVLLAYLSQVENTIQGTMITGSLSQLVKNIDTVCEEYGITKLERSLIDKSDDPHKSLLESILSRMASRDLFRP
ncbi:unnamed protein product [Schistosoma rodhaini]|uniref:EKC/KEOPS complex subunit CGI121 n=1 Tax=Schistosoma rodhaini TaxID=6188 RepID=A0AA85FLU6_9TREM|nr:unnamed protein product [Schistosoma rodhaini]